MGASQETEDSLANVTAQETATADAPAPSSDASGACDEGTKEDASGKKQETIFEIKEQLNSKDVKLAGKINTREICLDKIRENKELRATLLPLGLCAPLDPAFEGLNLPVSNYRTYTPYHDYTLEELKGLGFDILKSLLFSVQNNTSGLLDGARVLSGSEYTVFKNSIIHVVSACEDDTFTEEERKVQEECANRENLQSAKSEVDLNTFIGGLPNKKSALRSMGKKELVELAWELVTTVKDMAAVIVRQNQLKAAESAEAFGQKSEKSQYICGGEQGDDGEKTPSGEGNGKPSGKGSGKKGGSPKNPAEKDKDKGAGQGEDSGEDAQPRHGYGKADNSKSRKKPGCVTDNTDKLNTIKVYSGELSDEELMKAFGITDPSELSKVRRLTGRPTETVYVVPATSVSVLNYHYTYVYNKVKFTAPQKASQKKVLPGSVTSESVLAYLFDQMTTHHQPMNRIAEEFREMGFEIGRQAYPRWAIRMAWDYLGEVYLRLEELLKENDHLHIDETYFQVIHDGRKAGSKSYMWIFRPSELLKNAKPITFFHFDETRGTDVLREILAGWSGVISCDGFIDYKTFKKENLERIWLATCWAHLRRKLAKACRVVGIKSIPKEKRDMVPAYHALAEIAKIFRIEKGLKDVGPEERRRVRNGEMREIMEGLFQYFRNLKEKGNLGAVTADAVGYALNMEESLLFCLEDPLVPLTNSHAERGAMYFALSRNCFKEIDSEDGGYATAVLMTLACTARDCGANVYLYFKYLLERLPALVKEHGKATGGQGRKKDLSYLDSMLPWSAEYRAYEASERKLLNQAGAYAAAHWYAEKGYTVEVPASSQPGCGNDTEAA